jgi:excisionase family DNA binding protein
VNHTQMAAFEKTQSGRKRLYSIPEAGEYLGRTAWAVRHLIWNGNLPSVRIGKRVQVDIKDMDALIEKSKD